MNENWVRELYHLEEEGTSEGAKKGWAQRVREHATKSGFDVTSMGDKALSKSHEQAFQNYIAADKKYFKRSGYNVDEKHIQHHGKILLAHAMELRKRATQAKDAKAAQQHGITISVIGEHLRSGKEGHGSSSGLSYGSNSGGQSGDSVTGW